MGNLGQGTNSEVPQGRARGRSHFLTGPSVTGDFPSSLLISISAQLLMSLQNSQGTSVLPRCSAQLLVGLCPASLRPGATTLSTLPVLGLSRFKQTQGKAANHKGHTSLALLLKMLLVIIETREMSQNTTYFPCPIQRRLGR